MAKSLTPTAQGWGEACRSSLLLGWAFALADAWLLGWRNLWPSSGLAQALQTCAVVVSPSPFLLRVIAGVDNTLLVTLLMAITFASSGQLSLVMVALVGWVVATRLLVAPLSAKVWAKLTGLDAALVVFFATYGVATAFASTQPQALIGLAKMALYAGVWLAFRLLALTHRRFASIAVVTLALAGVVQAGIGWWQQLHYVPALATWSDAASQHPDAVLTRVYGTILPLNPNLYAGVLLPCWAAVLACCGLVLWRPAGLTGWQAVFRLRWVWVLVSVAALALVSLAIIWSGSRGAYLGLGGMLLTAYLGVLTYVTVDRFQRYKPWLLAGWCLLLALGVAGLGALLAIKPEIAHRLSTITAGHKDSSIAYRLNVYASCWQMVLHNPWVGIGPGNGVFKQLYGLYMVPGFNALGTYSVPLAVAVEQGILGILALLSLLWLALTNALSWLGDEQLAPHQRWWLLCVAVAVVGLSCQGMFDTVMYRPPVQVALWLWVAIGFSLLPPWATQQRPPRGVNTPMPSSFFNVLQSPPLASDVQRVALVCFGGIGDVLLFSSVVRKLRHALGSQLNLTLYLEDRSLAARDLVAEVDGIVPISVQGVSRRQVFSTLATDLQRRHFDGLILTGRSPFLPLLAKASGIPYTVGYHTRWGTHRLYSASVAANTKAYAGTMYAELATAFLGGLATLTPLPWDELNALPTTPYLAQPSQEACLKAADKLIIKPFLSTQDDDKPNPLKTVLIHPGVSQVSLSKGIRKQWTPVAWAQVVLQLSHRNRVVLVGGPDDAATLDAITAMLPPNLHHVVNLKGRTRSLAEVAALMRLSDVVVCVDSCPLHMAVGLDRPVVTLFGPTDEKLLTPPNAEGNRKAWCEVITVPDLPCRPCLWATRQRNCEASSCLNWDVAEVTRTVNRVLYYTQLPNPASLLLEQAMMTQGTLASTADDETVLQLRSVKVV